VHILIRIYEYIYKIITYFIYNIKVLCVCACARARARVRVCVCAHTWCVYVYISVIFKKISKNNFNYFSLMRLHCALYRVCDYLSNVFVFNTLAGNDLRNYNCDCTHLRFDRKTNTSFAPTATSDFNGNRLSFIDHIKKFHLLHPVRRRRLEKLERITRFKLAVGAARGETSELAILQIPLECSSAAQFLVKSWR